MDIGYNQACGRDCSTLEQDLQLCEAHGFDFIEIRLDMLKAYLQQHTLDDLCRFFAASRLRPHAINALYLYSELFSAEDDPSRHDEFIHDFLLSCRAAQLTGGGHIIVVPPLHREPAQGEWRGEWPDTLRHCVRILSRLSEMAQPWGVRLCFELVGFARSSVRSVAQAKAIVSQVNRDNVGFVFDAWNMYLFNGNQAFAGLREVAAEKIFAIHINNGDDVAENERGQQHRRFCDSGVVDLGYFLRELKATGYHGMVSIETFRPEYWQKTAAWVVGRAWETTRQCLLQYQCR